MNKLIVALNGLEVGVLFRDKKGAMSFQYTNEWLKEPGTRAISLSLPLSNQKYVGQEVFNFFDNLLPDSREIIARMQARFQITSKHPFDLLASVGRDCVGAIQLYQEGNQIPPIDEVHAEPLDERAIVELLEGYKTTPLGMNNSDNFRISLAGAQEKTALLWHQGCWQRPYGSTPTSHIFKLPIGRIEHNNIDLHESCENEWLCLKIARTFGLPVANAELAKFGEKTVLIVERFDRRWSCDNRWLMRLPQEDMCQAMGIAPALKYEADGGPGIADIMTLLLGSRNSITDRETFFKSQILYWLLAAIDGHGKNFSIFIEPDSSYSMTPLYDILSAYPIFGAKGVAPKKAKMAMALRGKSRQYHWATIQPRHFPSTARQVGFSESMAEKLMNEMGNMAEKVINQVANELPPNFPGHISDAIFTGLAKQAGRLCAG
ncbi:type II toxin-antitoxin system HipA family toxin [Xenorhabdus nematophila]|uniref:type II toxin-antitoxin system HipA family toxin n=1 Tax=Xenorhabdus nematophila TaxID=628 RepID=UPI00032755D1|nr:type II toxin-antitoxin system HipA family toxin [Xenorhabdus nematophila]CEE92539.1 HipA protein [Xenorhabdus nematophila str. Anatoliense]CEF30560.1 HipA protein [Xenorhabdus nematophila str. Websteri]AYA41970.1 type II toxin-antitoxin system HipA family toxin [Xenorhabdus nematophila]KHD27408.1 serine/threonine protein kinase [Xenorhabdus nematophila]MBA0020693.1 type II toxin-antitoxin system HipA family toxin [Xenorhabdus nematophila]